MSTSPLVIHYKALYTQKQGFELPYYEDAFALDGVAHIDSDGGQLETQQGWIHPQNQIWRCAVSDGAAEGGFSKWWARLIVDQYTCNDEHPRYTPPVKGDLSGIQGWLKTLAQEWRETLMPALLSKHAPGTPKYGRIQQALLKGQAATLVTLDVNPDGFYWASNAVGDAMLFHLDRGLNVLPIRPAASMTAAQLDTNPILISTQANFQDDWIWNNRRFNRGEAYVTGSFNPGDFFLLMTDAMAKWFLRVVVEGGDQDSRREVMGLPDSAAFTQWVEARRALAKDDHFFMGNDDTTLVMIQPQFENKIDNPKPQYIPYVKPLPIRRPELYATPEPAVASPLPPMPTQPVQPTPTAPVVSTPASTFIPSTPSPTPNPASPPTQPYSVPTSTGSFNALGNLPDEDVMNAPSRPPNTAPTTRLPVSGQQPTIPSPPLDPGATVPNRRQMQSTPPDSHKGQEIMQRWVDTMGQIIQSISEYDIVDVRNVAQKDLLYAHHHLEEYSKNSYRRIERYKYLQHFAESRLSLQEFSVVWGLTAYIGRLRDLKDSKVGTQEVKVICEWIDYLDESDKAKWVNYAEDSEIRQRRRDLIKEIHGYCVGNPRHHWARMIELLKKDLW
jgi:hypothetical protein